MLVPGGRSSERSIGSGASLRSTPTCRSRRCCWFGGVASSLTAMCLQCYDSLYNLVTELWSFLGQVIHANPKLAATVEGFLAWRLGQGLPPCSSDTGAYAGARQRLREALLAMLTRHTGTAAGRAAIDPWRWLG